MLDNLNKVLDIIEKNHIDFYFEHSKDDLEEYKKEALSKFKLEDDYDLCYIVNYIIKRMCNKLDSHTYVSAPQRKGDNLAVTYRFINNKLYVTRIDNDNIRYKYCEVSKINGIDINQLINEEVNIIPYLNDGKLASEIEWNFTRKEQLRCLPSISNDLSDVNISVIKDEKEEKVNLKSGYFENDNYKYFIDKDIMRIVYSDCSEDFENQMLNFIDEIKQYNNISNYIVDLRGNTGGNSTIIKPLVEYLKDKKVTVLVDKYVFSSGVLACVDLKKIGSTFIGTDIATPFNHFGENPHEKFGNLRVSASTKFFPYKLNLNFEVNSKDKLERIKNIPNVFEPIYFHPDIYVEESIDALKEGRDVYLEKAYEYIENKKIGGR